MGPEKTCGVQKHTYGRAVSQPTTSTKDTGIVQKLYAVLQKEVSTDKCNSFMKDAKKWVLDFTNIYQAKHVTPYIHILAKHIPEFLQKYKNINQFTMQGMEKINDQTTLDFAKSTNHNYHNLDALKQLMQKRNRIEYLEDHGFQRSNETVTCSVCKEKGHNRRTCKKASSVTVAEPSTLNEVVDSVL